MEISNESERFSLLETLEELKHQGFVVENEIGKYQAKETKTYLTGTIDFTTQGTAFVIISAEELSSSLKAYVDIRIKELKFEIAEKTSDLLSFLISGDLLIGVFLFALLFLSLAASFALNEWLGNSWIGFLIVAVLDILIGMMVWKNKIKIIKIPIMNALIKRLYNGDEKN